MTIAADKAGKFLKTLPDDVREKLRRVCLVSTASEDRIAQEVGCIPAHVKAMRDRLIGLGVLPKPEITPPPVTGSLTA